MTRSQLLGLVASRYASRMAVPRAIRIAGRVAIAAGGAIVFACSGNATVDSASSGDSTSSGGGASYTDMSCQELGVEYLKQFEQARLCAPELSTVQCTLSTYNELYCPCPRLVNPANTSAVANLNEIRAAWVAKSCPPAPPVCDAGTCPIPNSGVCAPQPQGSSAPGLCQDQY